MGDAIFSGNAEYFISGQKNILISTRAFRTGIAVANVRTVIHVGASEGLEAWYQESGRAGRGGKPANAFIWADIEGDEVMDLLNHASSRENRDALQQLREDLETVRSPGSFCRHMFFLIGNQVEWDVEDISLVNSLPNGVRMASFPGWRVEHNIYNRHVAHQVCDASKLKTTNPAGAMGIEYELFFHKAHDNHVWKAIQRLVELDLILPSYRRTYHRTRPNSFTFGILIGLEKRAAPERLKTRISHFIAQEIAGAREVSRYLRRPITVRADEIPAM